jgi:hypothetical protein
MIYTTVQVMGNVINKHCPKLVEHMESTLLPCFSKDAQPDTTSNATTHQNKDPFSPNARFQQALCVPRRALYWILDTKAQCLWKSRNKLQIAFG